MWILILEAPHPIKGQPDFAFEVLKSRLKIEHRLLNRINLNVLS